MSDRMASLKTRTGNNVIFKQEQGGSRMTQRPAILDLVVEDKLDLLRDTVASFPNFEDPACHGEDPELFDPKDAKQESAAKAVCSGCPEIKKCFAFALENGEIGVWGGTTYEERQVIAAGSQALTSSALISREDAVSQLRKIMHGDIQSLAKEYQVDRRTIHRWRHLIEANEVAYQLAA